MYYYLQGNRRNKKLRFLYAPALFIFSPLSSLEDIVRTIEISLLRKEYFIPLPFIVLKGQMINFHGIKCIRDEYPKNPCFIDFQMKNKTILSIVYFIYFGNKKIKVDFDKIKKKFSLIGFNFQLINEEWWENNKNKRENKDFGKYLIDKKENKFGDEAFENIFSYHLLYFYGGLKISEDFLLNKLSKEENFEKVKSYFNNNIQSTYKNGKEIFFKEKNKKIDIIGSKKGSLGIYNLLNTALLLPKSKFNDYNTGIGLINKNIKIYPDDLDSKILKINLQIS